MHLVIPPEMCPLEAVFIQAFSENDERGTRYRVAKIALVLSNAAGETKLKQSIGLWADSSREFRMNMTSPSPMVEAAAPGDVLRLWVIFSPFLIPEDGFRCSISNSQISVRAAGPWREFVDNTSDSESELDNPLSDHDTALLGGAPETDSGAIEDTVTFIVDEFLIPEVCVHINYIFIHIYST